MVERRDISKGHKLRGHGDGPFRVSWASDDGAVVNLENPKTGAPRMDRLTGLPDQVATRRLMKFLVDKPDDIPEAGLELSKVGPGHMVAWTTEYELKLLKVSKVTPEVSMTGMIWEVPASERYGLWKRRPWREVEGGVEVQVLWSNLVCKVSLTTGAVICPQCLTFLFCSMEPVERWFDMKQMEIWESM